jgi:predicted nucleic acid-binding protein
MDNFKQELTQRLESKFPDFQKEWNSLVFSYGDSFVSSIRRAFSKELSPLKELASFKLSIVIDNNFLFSQINGVINNKSDIKDTFIYKLTSSKLVTIYAPFKIKDEIASKIKLKIKRDKKKAQEYADLILSKVIINDAQWACDWKKATTLIGDIDTDDVPYLALALHTESHSIISNDEVFGNQGSSKVWTISDTKNVLATYNSGFISFCIVGATTMIIKSFFDLLLIVLQLIGQLLIELLTAIGSIIAFGIDVISKIPSEILIILIGVYLGGLIFSDEFRESNLKGLENMETFLKKALDNFEKFIKDSANDLIEFLKEFKPIGMTILEILAFLTLEYKMMEDQIKKLEKERAK